LTAPFVGSTGLAGTFRVAAREEAADAARVGADMSRSIVVNVNLEFDALVSVCNVLPTASFTAAAAYVTSYCVFTRRSPGGSQNIVVPWKTQVLTDRRSLVLVVPVVPTRLIEPVPDWTSSLKETEKIVLGGIIMAPFGGKMPVSVGVVSVSPIGYGPDESVSGAIMLRTCT
jgi:hypothetical protein